MNIHHWFKCTARNKIVKNILSFIFIIDYSIQCFPCHLPQRTSSYGWNSSELSYFGSMTCTKERKNSEFKTQWIKRSFVSWWGRDTQWNTEIIIYQLKWYSPKNIISLALWVGLTTDRDLAEPSCLRNTTSFILPW